MIKKSIALFMAITAFTSSAGCTESFNKEVKKNINSQAESSMVAQETSSPTEPQTMPVVYVPSDCYSIEVEPVLQMPEFPTGCEITSLTTVLNHLGYNIDKVTLYEDYFEKDLNGVCTFDEAFVGNPRADNGFGCYSPVITDSANKYLTSNGSEYTAENLRGTDFQDLFQYIEMDIPVIVWTTMSLRKPERKFYWTTPDGDEAWWYRGEHCVVLTGFDFINNTITTCDPQKGVYEYPLDKFEERYNDLEKQAVVIK